MPHSKRLFEFDATMHITNKLNPELKLHDNHIHHVKDVFLRAKQKFNVEIISYSISNNHFHLEVFFPKKTGVTVSKLMHWIGTVLAMKINKLLNRHGRVFIDRFKSKIIKTKQYLERVTEYIMYNIVKHLGDKVDIEKWKWSSYRYYKYGERDDLVTHYSKIAEYLKGLG